MNKTGSVNTNSWRQRLTYTVDYKDVKQFPKEPAIYGNVILYGFERKNIQTKRKKTKGQKMIYTALVKNVQFSNMNASRISGELCAPKG